MPDVIMSHASCIMRDVSFTPSMSDLSHVTHLLGQSLRKVALLTHLGLDRCSGSLQGLHLALQLGFLPSQGLNLLIRLLLRLPQSLDLLLQAASIGLAVLQARRQCFPLLLARLLRLCIQNSSVISVHDV